MGMNHASPDLLQIHRCPPLQEATLLLAFAGWMDGGDVSTGTVRRLVHLLGAQTIAEIDPEPFYVFNLPGSMELATLFRPHVEIAGGVVKHLALPTNTFYVHDPGNLVLFIGQEPHLQWRTFGACIFDLAHQLGVRRMLFVGSFGGAVPHTREPRLYVTCSDPQQLPELTRYRLRTTQYQGPGSFTTYLMTQAPSAGVEMTALVAEIPGYLQGANPLCIEAVTRRLAKILRLPLDLAAMRTASTAWELEISSVIEQNEELAETVRRLEEAYDNELLELDADNA